MKDSKNMRGAGRKAGRVITVNGRVKFYDRTKKRGMVTPDDGPAHGIEGDIIFSNWNLPPDVDNLLQGQQVIVLAKRNPNNRHQYRADQPLRIVGKLLTEPAPFAARPTSPLITLTFDAVVNTVDVKPWRAYVRPVDPETCAQIPLGDDAQILVGDLAFQNAGYSPGDIVEGLRLTIRAVRKTPKGIRAAELAPKNATRPPVPQKRPEPC